MVGFVEEVGHRHGVEHPIQMTVATSDGERLWAFRYSSEGDSRIALLHHAARPALRRCYPDARGWPASRTSRASSSRSRSATCEGVWNAVPESSWGVVQEGEDELHPFAPARP